MTEPVFVLGGLQTDFARNWAREGLEIADAMREIRAGRTRAGPARGERRRGGPRRQLRRRTLLQPGSPGRRVCRNRIRTSPACPPRVTRARVRPAAWRCWRRWPTSNRGATDSRPWSASSRCATFRASRPRSTSARQRCGPGTSAATFVSRGRTSSASSATSTIAASGCATNISRALPRSISPMPGATRMRRRAAGRSPGRALRPTTRRIRSSRVASASRIAGRSPTVRPSCSWPMQGALRSTPGRADSISRHCRASAAGDTGRRRSPTRPRCARARAIPTCFRRCAVRSLDAFRRAGVSGVDELDGIETHDCFTTTEYMAIDHFGITPPGESWRAIEGGDIEIGGRIPVNPSGGLIGTGHPVGATGVRMALDCYKQVTGTAGEYQVPGRPDVRDAEHRRQRHDHREPGDRALTRALQSLRGPGKNAFVRRTYSA